MTESVKSSIWVFLLGVSLAIVWYFAWVQPKDEVLKSIMDCMNGDRSHEAYEYCRNKIVGETQ